MNSGYWKRFLYLENKLINLSDYVAIDERNFETYSLEIMSLYLAACSEIEAVFKQINNNRKSNYNFKNFRDDFDSMVNNELLLDEISLRYYSIKIKPFENIANKDDNGDFFTIEWWQSHNKVKHNRESQFHKATLKNLLEALAALFLLNLYLYFEINQRKNLSPIPQLFETKNFYISMLIGGGDFKYIKAST